MKRSSKPKANWTQAFPEQARRLNPERSAAGGIKARSGTEAARMAVYRPIAQLYLAQHQQCEVSRTCYDAQATAVHHRKGRAGLLLCDVRYFTAVCWWCHRWIHDHPAEARKMGWLC